MQDLMKQNASRSGGIFGIARFGGMNNVDG